MYFLESHIRNTQVLQVLLQRTSVLLRFSNLIEIEKCTQFMCLKQSYYQSQFIQMKIYRELSSNVLCSNLNSRRRMNCQELSRHNHKILEINTLGGLSVEGNWGCYMQEKRDISTTRYLPRLTLTTIKKVQRERI